MPLPSIMPLPLPPPPDGGTLPLPVAAASGDSARRGSPPPAPRPTGATPMAVSTTGLLSLMVPVAAAMTRPPAMPPTPPPIGDGVRDDPPMLRPPRMGCGGTGDDGGGVGDDGDPAEYPRRLGARRCGRAAAEEGGRGGSAAAAARCDGDGGGSVGGAGAPAADADNDAIVGATAPGSAMDCGWRQGAPPVVCAATLERRGLGASSYSCTVWWAGVGVGVGVWRPSAAIQAPLFQQGLPLLCRHLRLSAAAPVAASTAACSTVAATSTVDRWKRALWRSVCGCHQHTRSGTAIRHRPTSRNDLAPATTESSHDGGRAIVARLWWRFEEASVTAPGRQHHRRVRRVVSSLPALAAVTAAAVPAAAVRHTHTPAGAAAAAAAGDSGGSRCHWVGAQISKHGQRSVADPQPEQQPRQQ